MRRNGLWSMMAFLGFGAFGLFVGNAEDERGTHGAAGSSIMRAVDPNVDLLSLSGRAGDRLWNEAHRRYARSLELRLGLEGELAERFRGALREAALRNRESGVFGYSSRAMEDEAFLESIGDILSDEQIARFEEINERNQERRLQLEAETRTAALSQYLDLSIEEENRVREVYLEHLRAVNSGKRGETAGPRELRERIQESLTGQQRKLMQSVFNGTTGEVSEER